MPKDYQALHINLGGNNRLAIVFDTPTANIPRTVCIAIFDVGGKTPQNRHPLAVEMFSSLKVKDRRLIMAKQYKFALGIVF
jgi:hypothetical protein